MVVSSFTCLMGNHIVLEFLEGINVEGVFLVFVVCSLFLFFNLN